MTKEKLVTLRLTQPEEADLKAVAAVTGKPVRTLAANWVREGVRRARFPAIEFRDGLPGRVAYLAGTRWPVWMIAQLVEECAGNTAAAAKHMQRPEALVKMALLYAKAYAEEIQACRDTGGYTSTSDVVQDLIRQAQDAEQERLRHEFEDLVDHSPGAPSPEPVDIVVRAARRIKRSRRLARRRA